MAFFMEFTMIEFGIALWIASYLLEEEYVEEN
jgi:hypothetical protein